jgi:hypothetical protein
MHRLVLASVLGRSLLALDLHRFVLTDIMATILTLARRMAITGRAGSQAAFSSARDRGITATMADLSTGIQGTVTGRVTAMSLGAFINGRRSPMDMPAAGIT